MRNSLLDGKTAIVTGAASGMGRAIASLFHAQGARIVAADLNGAAAEALARELGGNVLAVQADVSSEESVSALARQSVERFETVDILVNCAGVPQVVTPIEELDEQTWQRIMNVNAKSIFLTAKHLVPVMKASGGGAIVTIASVVGVRPKPLQNAYCASKAAAIALSQSLALELAPSGIRVNIINPGAAETPMLGQFLKPDVAVEDARKVFASNIPLGKLVQPGDVAEAALYLASPLAAMMTGAVINVDGGRCV